LKTVDENGDFGELSFLLEEDSEKVRKIIEIRD